jgi:hypothetical protein
MHMHGSFVCAAQRLTFSSHRQSSIGALTCGSTYSICLSVVVQTATTNEVSVSSTPNIFYAQDFWWVCHIQRNFPRCLSFGTPVDLAFYR